MIQEGQITLFAFPQTDQAAGNFDLHWFCGLYQVHMRIGLFV